MPATRPSLVQLRDAAIGASHASGRELMKRFRKKLKISEKPGAGIVTDADLASERVALKALKLAFPKFGILTEESGVKEARSAGRWIIDPLDGTTNYAHGFPMFCVSIAAEWEGEIVAGVIFHPTLGETFTAIKGKGAFVNGRRMQVSTTRDTGNALLSTGFTSKKEEWLEQELGIFEKLSRAAQGVRRPGSAALDMAYVARGTFDGYWERGLSAWDVAAGKILIEEAGGKVTDFKGKSFCLDSGEVFSSNGVLHSQLLRQAQSNVAKKTMGSNERRNEIQM
jgi:myo-inositol-1(or 4)-monophosphatase